MSSTRELKANQIKNGSGLLVPNTSGTVTVPNGTDTVATLTATQTFTNKTHTAPVVGNYQDMSEQGSSPSTPSAGSLRVYAKSSDSKLYTKNSSGVETQVGSGSGGGSGGVNYITATDAETGTTGWATYADAAGAVPVNGTGGSATVTWTTTTTTPLRGLSSFLLTKDAANRQGEGVSYDFTIDRADVNKVLKIAFDYTVSSGTFVAGSSSDVRVFIYDVTNSQLIYPVDFKLNSTSVDSFQGTFQTTSSLSYRLIFHVATTSASAYVLKIDNVQVGPQSALYGAVVTDWVSYTPTGSWVANTTYTGFWRRVGSKAELRIRATTSGAPTSATWTASLPAGLSIDTAKLTGADSSASFGTGIALANPGVSYYEITAVYNSATTLKAVTLDNAAASVHILFDLTDTVPNTFGTGSIIEIEASVPIQGWGSAVQMSDAADTRVLAASAGGATASYNSGDIIIHPTVDFDTHGAYNSSTGRFTVPSQGYYQVETYTLAANGSYTVFLNKNGSDYKSLAFADAASGRATGSLTLFCQPGDLLDIRPNATTGAFDPQSWVTFKRLSGPAAIAANELVAARYSTTAQQSLTTGVNAIVDYDTVDVDTHGTVTTGGSWKFTAPVAGLYSVSALCAFTANVTGNRELYVFKNGTGFTVLGAAQGAATPTYLNGSALIRMIPGDYIDIQAYQASGGALTLNPSASLTDMAVNIYRVGF